MSYYPYYYPSYYPSYYYPTYSRYLSADLDIIILPTIPTAMRVLFAGQESKQILPSQDWEDLESKPKLQLIVLSVDQELKPRLPPTLSSADPESKPSWLLLDWPVKTMSEDSEYKQMLTVFYPGIDLMLAIIFNNFSYKKLYYTRLKYYLRANLHHNKNKRLINYNKNRQK